MAMTADDLSSGDPIAWCPGCGNFGILAAVKNALRTIEADPAGVVLVSGIGQAAKLPHYVKCNCFNGLHGRALPAAAGIKIANRALTVVVTTGDGDCYGEGGNHFLHNIRRNVDLTVVVHDNQVYGLTKGQASPTTDAGVVTKVQRSGVFTRPFHPLEAAIALGCGFVARGFSGRQDHLASLIVKGIRHRGFSLIDVLQPCVTFNRKNTFEWYSKRVYELPEDGSYDPRDKYGAYRKAAEWDERIPLGVIFIDETPPYEEASGLAAMAPLVDADIGMIDISQALGEYA
jgi:2-oxoglutarate/2-oxoacid ferredoxin oxidoreductase subunit beta